MQISCRASANEDAVKNYNSREALAVTHYSLRVICSLLKRGEFESRIYSFSMGMSADKLSSAPERTTGFLNIVIVS